MIRHLVCFRLQDRGDLDEVSATLWTLADIPGVRAFEVGVNTHVDPYADLTSVRAAAQSGAQPGPIDLVVHALFDDEATLAAFRQHPIYAASVARVRPKRELRIAVDFPVPAASTHPGVEAP